MGSEYRDYMQDDEYTREQPWGHDVPTTKWLMVTTVIVFFLQLILMHGNASYVDDWCFLDASAVLHGQVWRLVTYVFCHSNPVGLVFNMWALWAFFPTLERMYGSREALYYYLGSALFCGLVFTSFELRGHLPSPIYGSNPCIIAVLTLFATHFPKQEVLFFFILPVQIRVLLLIYVGFDLCTTIQVHNSGSPLTTLAYLSNIWGIGFGLVYRRANWRLADFVQSIDPRRIPAATRRALAARRLKVYHPEPVSNLDEQVDAILAKIHEKGSESLTDRERAILQRASEQAKDRL